STPPAGTVIGVHAVFVEFGTQHRVWIVPGVLGSRCPWKSLNASSATDVSLSFGPLAAMAVAGRRATTAVTSAARTRARPIRIRVSPLPCVRAYVSARSPASGRLTRFPPSATGRHRITLVLRVGPGVAETRFDRERWVERIG